MKPALLLSLLLLIIPSSFSDFKKDKRVIFGSLSYYGSDFDGDKAGDLSVWDSRTNTLYFQLSSDNKFYTKNFFTSSLNYTPAFADYDGDQKTDFAFFQNDSGEWTIYPTLSPGFEKRVFAGSIDDHPIPAMVDSDNFYKPTVWRPINAGWFLTKNENGESKHDIIFDGSYQDSVFAGDYDGDGKSDLLNWRPDDGYWHIVKSGTNFDFNQSEHIQHGKEWDIIVPNDYDGDGRCDLVFWRPSNKTWYFRYASDQRQEEIKFGNEGDIPASLDTDSDGIPELVLWNPSKKTWNILNLTNKEAYSYKWKVPDGCLPAVSVIDKFE